MVPLSTHSPRRLFPKADGIIVVRERILRLQPHESRQSLDRFFRRSALHTLHLPHEQIRSRIVRGEIGRVHEALRSSIVGAARVPAYSECDQHPHGLWKLAIAFCEELTGRLHRTLSHNIGSPLTQMRIARAT